MRECPRCQEVMTSRSFDGRLRDVHNNPISVEMDACGNCGGFWFDQYEAEATMGLRGELRELGGMMVVPSDNNKLACPSCALAMAHGKILGMELDVCRSCQGVWFDQGELQDLNAALKSNGLMLSAKDGITCGRCGQTGLERGDTYYDVGGAGLICARCNEGNEVRATERRAAEAEAERRARWRTPRRHTSENSIDIGDLVSAVADVADIFF